MVLFTHTKRRARYLTLYKIYCKVHIMEKKITVYEVTHLSITVAYLTKGEAEKAVAVLNAFGMDATIQTAKRIATIA